MASLISIRLNLLVVLLVFSSNTFSSNLASKYQVKKVGDSQFTYLFWDIYHSQLFTPSGSFSPNMPPYLFELTYQRDISKADLIDNTITQWQHLELNQDEYTTYISLLRNIWPDISAGDKLSIVVLEQHNRFYFNEQFIGEINDGKFGLMFLDIWLSPKTSHPKLREKLLSMK